jgi:hypothetical protein
MKRFWSVFRGRLWQVAIVPAGVVVFDLFISALRWVMQQLAGQAFLDQFDAWARRHNMPATLLNAVLFAQNNPITTAVILAAVAIGYAAIRSEYDVRRGVPLSSATQNDVNKAGTQTEAPTQDAVLEHKLEYSCELEVKLLHFQDGFFRLVAAHETWTHCGFALQVIRPLPYWWDKKSAEVVGISARVVYLEEIEEPTKRKGAKPRIRTQRMCTVYQGAWVGTVGGIKQLGGGDIGYLIVAVSTKTDPIHWYGVETHQSMVIGHKLLLVPTDGTKGVEISFIVDGVDIAQGVLIDVDLSPATRRIDRPTTE